MTDHATCILQHISWESSHENGDFWFIIDIWFFQFIAKQVNCTLLKNSCTYKMAHYLVWLIMGKKKRRKDKKSDESTILKSIYSSPLKHYCPHVSPWKWIQLLVDQTFDISIVVRCTGGFYSPPPHTNTPPSKGTMTLL